jgi:hypothetical protein
LDLLHDIAVVVMRKRSVHEQGKQDQQDLLTDKIHSDKLTDLFVDWKESHEEDRVQRSRRLRWVWRGGRGGGTGGGISQEMSESWEEIGLDVLLIEGREDELQEDNSMELDCLIRLLTNHMAHQRDQSLPIVRHLNRLQDLLITEDRDGDGLEGREGVEVDGGVEEQDDVLVEVWPREQVQEEVHILKEEKNQLPTRRAEARDEEWGGVLKEEGERNLWRDRDKNGKGIFPKERILSCGGD